MNATFSTASPRPLAEPDLTLVANPYGFAEWFKAVTPVDHEFADIFAKRAGEYERLVLLEKADTEDMPDRRTASRRR